jgi:hypothetical protein
VVLAVRGQELRPLDELADLVRVRVRVKGQG